MSDDYRHHSACLSLRVSPQLLLALRELADREQNPMSAIVRRLLVAGLPREQRAALRGEDISR